MQVFLRYLRICVIFPKIGPFQGQGHSHSKGHDPNLNRLRPLTHIYVHVKFGKDL